MPQLTILGSLSARRKKPWLVRYGFALLAVAVAVGLTLSVSAIRTGTPFMFFFLSVAVSALWGSFRAGLFAIALSIASVAVWIMPSPDYFHITGVELAQLSAFVLVSSLISWLVYSVDTARHVIYEQSESLRTTLASIGDAVIASDTNGDVVWMNAVASTLTGWPIAEAIGKPLRQIFNIVHEVTRVPVESPVARVLAEGRVVGLANHTVLIARDGVEWPIDDSAAPIKDAQGQMTGVVLIFHDIRERRAREQALQATEERLRMALEAARMVAWEWDPVADQIWTNGSFIDIYGVQGLQVVADGMKLVHPDDLMRHQAAVGNVASEGGTYHSEFRITRPHDQRVVWIEERASAITDSVGKVQKLAGVSMDVTERKEAEIALSELNETLEQRVTLRTQELEQINRELAQFTYVVSHDLKSPLRAITTMSNWIGEEPTQTLSEQSKKHLIKIQQRVQRMETMLNDLVSYTRAGRVRYQEQQVNAALLIKDIVSQLDAPPGFSTSIVEPMPIFVTERVPLETVLQNLIGNALKHHHRPEIGHLIISAHDLGGMVEFSVNDNGPGIASEQQVRVFGVFQTLRPRDEVEGSGMGLAIAKRLVEGRGGLLEVRSNLGDGSTFRFTWPKHDKLS